MGSRLYIIFTNKLSREKRPTGPGGIPVGLPEWGVGEVLVSVAYCEGAGWRDGAIYRLDQCYTDSNHPVYLTASCTFSIVRELLNLTFWGKDVRFYGRM